MKTHNATYFPYRILQANNNPQNPPYPILKSENGAAEICSISYEHGRSYVLGRNNNRFIISKGNGLSYSRYEFLNFGDFGNDTFGLLLKEDAERDFFIGLEVEELGIRTNKMEYIIEVNKELKIPHSDIILKPILLQYTVECPYRISDSIYLDETEIKTHIDKWERFNTAGYKYKHLIAAEVLFRNLHILHNNHILHNAISSHNYTWALELLDFEIARTPKYPYTKSDYERHVCELYPREIIYTYQVITKIALSLNEPTDNYTIDIIMMKYGFNLSKYRLA